MNETPCYSDMCLLYNRTVHFKGDKTIDGLGTGHSQNRFTVLLCLATDGKIIRTMIISIGMKKIPRVLVLNNVEVTVSDGGLIDIKLMKHWMTSCFARRKGPFNKNKSQLLMESFVSHLKPEVVGLLQSKCYT